MTSIVVNMVKTRFVNLIITQFDAIKSALRSNLETLIKSNPKAAKEFLSRWTQLNTVIMEILASAQPAPLVPPVAPTQSMFGLRRRNVTPSAQPVTSPTPTSSSRFSLPKPSFLTPKVKASGGAKRTKRLSRRETL
jgi:hypothetical protein